MPGIYLYSDRTDLAAELIGFARRSDKETTLLTIDEKTALEMKNSGAGKIILLHSDNALIENYARPIAELLQKETAELFAVGSTPRGRDLAARVAGYLNCAMVSDACSITLERGQVIAERMIFGGTVQQTEILEGLCVLTIPAGKFATVTGDSDIVSIAVQADRRVILKETTPIIKGEVDISVAEKIVCVGMAMDKEEDLQMARDLAEVIGAEIACTRGIAEERHWLPVESYIGISGATIRPRLYISLGVSGQIQHVIGMRDSQIVVAINNNDQAPIFNSADYGIVGDIYEIVPLLTRELQSQ